MSPRSHPLQHHRMTTQAPLRIPPHRHAGSVDRQRTAGDDTFPRDAPAPTPQAQESPSYLRSAISNLMQRQQSGGTRSTNDVAPSLNSPSNIPLPLSPTTSTPSGSPTRLRLQAQPSHRSSPYMPFYPSLTVDREDDQQQQHTLLSPSGLDVPLGFASGFGRPTPHPSPIQVPATPAPAPATSAAGIRTPSPSADPRSPISRFTQIRGSIMGLSR